MLAILTFQKTATDSVNHADSGDIKILVQFPGNSILKFWVKFWNCVGGTHMRGCFVNQNQPMSIFFYTDHFDI